MDVKPPVWRALEPEEIAALESAGNVCDDWRQVLVSAETFDVALIRSCRLYGPIRIGRLERVFLERDGLRLPAGLYDSTIVACDIGHNVAIHHILHLSGYAIGDEVMLFDIGQMSAAASADAESEPWIEVWNEAGGRAILPFDGMRVGDAFLWARYRGDAPFVERLREMTEARRRADASSRAAVGANALVSGCRRIENTNIGPHALIRCADLLDRVTIQSDAERPTRLSAGVELVEGIVGAGSRVQGGARARRFLLGENTALENGVRVVHTVLGDNSTIACCEVFNSLIFPSHEQHHNNSFLIAALIQGQSNIAAGATIGSNHNSRGADGEIVARRGFWPSLCSNLKHNCQFASFTLLAKGSYTYEIDLPLPFSFVFNDEEKYALDILPAYWFLYNMYAIARNAWKIHARDKRTRKEQHIEFDYLAPDTVEEMFHALELLDKWTAAAAGAPVEMTDPAIDQLEVLAEGVENSRRPVRVLKVRRAHGAYRRQIQYYAIRTLARYMEENQLDTFETLLGALPAPSAEAEEWVNVGGQIVSAASLAELRRGVVSGETATWDDLHAVLDRLWDAYPEQKAAHALGAWLRVEGFADVDALNDTLWRRALGRARDEAFEIARLTRESRAKDYSHPFRQITYATEAEMNAVVGQIDDNSFIRQAQKDAEEFARLAERLGATKRGE